MRRTFLRLTLALLWWAMLPVGHAAQNSAQLFAAALQQVANLIEPPANTAPKTFVATLKMLQADGLPQALLGREMELAWQAPDRLRLGLQIDGQRFVLGRDGQEIWIHAPGKQFGVVGAAGVPRFAGTPKKLDETKLPPWKLPVPREQLRLLPLLCVVESLADERVDEVDCHVLRVTPRPEAVKLFKLQAGTLRLWLRKADLLPARIGWSDGRELSVVVALQGGRVQAARAATDWQIPSRARDRIERVALGHLTRFFPAAYSHLDNHIPTLGPVTGERRVLATHGRGRLELHDGTRVLFLKGTPEEMGTQHGTLLKAEVGNLVERVLYGVGVGSSFAKSRWFFSEIEEAQSRFGKFVDRRYTEEMDAMARAAGVEPEEARLANFFPELFHCSGFALWGAATADGRLYHGRVLDYMKGVGLEQNAVVIIHQPDQGHAWVNVGYAGLTGTVTAMNAKGVAVGEMGGRGDGQWDGKPMAQLLREVMEKAGTLDEAVEIMRRSPRTCEYYYVISEGKTRRAVGIAATPTRFEVIGPNQAHAQLPHPVKDAVLLSGGDRYEELVRRVKGGFGKFDPEGARGLMTRPVCMKSNIHSVLFAPETLDFWVAHADSKSVASHARYTHYNLAQLLGEKTKAANAAPFLEKGDLFEAGKEGYSLYRIPGIVVTKPGTVLAYCEARKSDRGDWGTIDILLRRSTDGGKTWGPRAKIADVPGPKSKNPVALAQKLATNDEVTYNNPVAIPDANGAVHFLFCLEYARCFYMRSDDDGVTFSKPVEITATFDKFRPEYDWKVLATGPAHGIQLKNGRLVVPVWISTGTGGHAHRPSVTASIYSDDGGKSWQRGAIAGPNTAEWKIPNETCAVQLADGRVLFNMRSESAAHRRLLTTGPDGATDWSKPKFHEQLLEPICMASMVRLSEKPASDKNRLLFANPDNLSRVGGKETPGQTRDRKNISVKLSYDEGETWPVSRTVETGFSGYSDLAVARDGTILLFYERGSTDGKNIYKSGLLTLARFNLEWLTAAKENSTR